MLKKHPFSEEKQYSKKKILNSSFEQSKCHKMVWLGLGEMVCADWGRLEREGTADGALGGGQPRQPSDEPTISSKKVEKKLKKVEKN